MEATPIALPLPKPCHTNLAYTGEATPRALCSVLGPSLQERHGIAGACPEKGKKAGEGSREQVLRRAAEGTGAV